MPDQLTVVVKIKVGGTTRSTSVTREITLGGDRRRWPKHLAAIIEDEAGRLGNALA